MCEFNSRCAKWNFGLDEYRNVGLIPGDPQPKFRVGLFLAMIEELDSDAESRKISGGHGDHPLRRIDSRNHVIEAPAVEHGRAHLGRVLPVRSAQIVKKTDGVASSGEYAKSSDIGRRGVALGGHAVQTRLRLALFVEIHFILQGKKVDGRGVRVELVVNRKQGTRGVHGMRDGAEMPRGAAEKIP